MDGITEEMISKMEDEITKHIFKNYSFNVEKLALDYTNYFTYIATSNGKSELAQRGHNKQKRNDLRQVSLALITTKELLNKGINIENDKLIEQLSEIREMYILDPNKKKKSGFEVKKELEEMTEYQKAIWDKLKEII